MNKRRGIGKKIFLSFIALLTFGGAWAQEAQDTLTLTLDKALQIALSENPVIKVAGQEIQLKKEVKREALGGLFPEVALGGSYTRSVKAQKMSLAGEVFSIGTKNTYGGGLTVSLPVFAPGLYKSISLTQSDVELALEKARSSKLDLVNQVSKAYYQLLLAQDSYDVLLRSYNQAEANYKIVDAMYKQGSVSEYDKIRADVQVRSLKPNVVSAHNGVDLARLQLQVLIGMDAGIPIAVVGNLKDHEMAMFQQQLSDVAISLENNSTLKQLDLNKELLGKNLKLQNTNFMPVVALSFDYMYTSMSDNFKFSEYNWYPKSALGLSFSIPLFKASNFSKVKQAKIQLLQLASNRVNIERQINMQATSYMDQMAASTEQVVSNREGIVQAEKGRQIAQKRYEIGNGTILEMNDSEVALTQAKLVYNQSIYDYLVAKADLDLVLGNNNMIEK